MKVTIILKQIKFCYKLLFLTILTLAFFKNFEIHHSKPQGKNFNCRSFISPDATEPWPTLKTPGGCVYVYSAFFIDSLDTKQVRIVALVQGSWEYSKYGKVVCNFLGPSGIQDTQPLSAVIRLFRRKPKPIHFQSYLLVFPFKNRSLLAQMSLSFHDPVIHDSASEPFSATEAGHRKTDLIAVCVKGYKIDFNNKKLSFAVERIVEWLELLSIMGVDKVFLYYYFLDSKIFDMLRQYKDEGFVETKLISIMGRKKKDGWFKDYDAFHYQQNVARTDCYYRVRPNYQWIVFLDMDEIIFPGTSFSTSLRSMLHYLERNSEPGTVSFQFPNYYFFDSEPAAPRQSLSGAPPLHTSRHLQRSSVSTNWWFSKPIVRTEYDCLMSVATHLPILHRPCNNTSDDFLHSMLMTREVGMLAHYRPDCQMKIDKAECERMKNLTVTDTTALRFADLVLKNVRRRMGRSFGSGPVRKQPSIMVLIWICMLT